MGKLDGKDAIITGAAMGVSRQSKSDTQGI